MYLSSALKEDRERKEKDFSTSLMQMDDNIICLKLIFNRQSTKKSNLVYIVLVTFFSFKQNYVEFLCVEKK